MRALLLCALLVALPTCERRNPQFCDGVEFFCARRQRCDVLSRSCIDVGGPGPVTDCDAASSCPGEQPLCDAEARVCRACDAGEDLRCAQRDARTPRCLGPSCVECISPGAESREAPECSRQKAQQPSPVCDRLGNACRPCKLHRECDSGVCAKDTTADAYGVPQGSCVPSDQVMVVDPSLCSESGPVFCTPRQALSRLDPKHRYVVFRKSARAEDFSELEIGRFENQGVDLHLIGPLADGPPTAGPYPRVEIGAPGRRGFVVNRKSRVTLEGFLIRGADVGVQCFGDGPNTDTQVRVLRSLLAENGTALSVHDDCLLTLEQSWLGRGPKGGAFGELRGNGLSIDVTRADFAIRNVVFSDNGDVARDLFGGIRVTAGLGGGVEGRRVSSLVNSTFYGHSAWITTGGARYTALVCEAPINGRLVVMNTLFFQDPKAPIYERYVTPSCGGLVYNVASEDATLSANGSVVLPRTELPGFRDAPSRDLHVGRAAVASPAWQQVLRGGAAAVTAGSQEVRAPAVDLDGAPRSQPGRVTMGAYEVEP